MKGGPYGVDDLLEAYADGFRPVPYGLRAFAPWREHVLCALCRCFGASFDERDVPAERRGALAALKRVLEHEARLPYPAQGALEAGLVFSQCPREFRALFARLRELEAFYRDVARDLAGRLWGELGERTEAQLAAAGFDPTREPVVNFDEL